MNPDRQNKLNRLIGLKYKAKLMNNTKWREVFTLLAQQQLQVNIAFIHSPDFPHQSLHRVSLDMVGESGLLDPGIGGPFYYKEVFQIRVPKVLSLPKTMRGEVYSYQEKDQDLDKLLKELRKLGQLPLLVTEDYLAISGYV